MAISKRKGASTTDQHRESRDGTIRQATRDIELSKELEPCIVSLWIVGSSEEIASAGRC